MPMVPNLKGDCRVFQTRCHHDAQPTNQAKPNQTKSQSNQPTDANATVVEADPWSIHPISNGKSSHHASHHQHSHAVKSCLNIRLSRLFVNANTAIQQPTRVKISLASRMGPTAHEGLTGHELPQCPTNPLQRMLGRTGEDRGVLHHLQSQLLPIVAVDGLDGNLKRRQPNGWMTDQTSRNPTQQTQNENPNQLNIDIKLAPLP